MLILESGGRAPCEILNTSPAAGVCKSIKRFVQVCILRAAKNAASSATTDRVTRDICPLGTSASPRGQIPLKLNPNPFVRGGADVRGANVRTRART